MKTLIPRQPPAVSLDTKRAFLQRSESYPERTPTVEAVETHMAWVFLTARYAYELKKPVVYPFLDYRTLEARRRVCLEEVRLNRRLAPDVYLGVVPVTLEPTGTLALDGRGEVVDWLVKMRRLPRTRMLDRLIRQHAVRPEDVRDLGETLGRFYADAPPVRVSPIEYRDRLRTRVGEDRSALSTPEFGLPSPRLDRIASPLFAFIERRADLLDRRVGEGRIVEGHGDLRPEHICLERRPVIIDCVEFRREFRILDPADDLAFLGLECERLGAGWIGDAVLDVYTRVTGDGPPADLVRFHRGCRALLRAKLAIWHTLDEGEERRSHWLASTDRYLRLAEQGLPGAT